MLTPGYKGGLDALAEGNGATGVTRDKWLLGRAGARAQGRGWGGRGGDRKALWGRRKPKARPLWAAPCGPLPPEQREE